jgi:hypothetical protein
MMERALRLLLDPANGAIVFPVALALYYGIWPWFVDHPSIAETRETFAILPWVAAAWVALGALPFRIRAFRPADPSRAVPFVYAVFIAFGVFVALTIATAPSIPLLKALTGAGVDAVAVSREHFLKARTGWAASLPYLNAMLTGSLLPYALALALLHRYRGAGCVLIGFLAYSLVFVEKAFFLRLLLPLMAVIVVSGVRQPKLSWLVAGGVALLAGNVLLSGFGEAGIGDFLLYRTLEVPVVTVADSLDFWLQRYSGEPLHGATSSLLSSAWGVHRIPFEREVFVYQYGAFETGTGSANAAYFVEAYVNFGYPGVLLLSVVLGAVLGYVGRSEDAALRCTLPLVMYTVFVGGMLGLLFSNGLLLVLLASRWITAGRVEGRGSLGVNWPGHG